MKTFHSQEPNSVPLTPLLSNLVFVCLLKAIKKKYCLKENCLSFYLIPAKMLIILKKSLHFYEKQWWVVTQKWL